MKSGKRNILKAVFYIISCLLVITFIRLLFYVYSDHAETLLKGYQKYLSAETTVVSADNSGTIYNVLIKRKDFPDLTCYLKVPVGGKSCPALILLGGLNSGKDVIELVGETGTAEKFVIMCMDYPYEGKKRNVPLLEFLREIPNIRNAIFDAVSAVMIMIDYLETRDEINKEQIFLAGGSFGAFFAIAAGALNMRIKAVISLYMGGDISLLVSEDLEWGPKFLRKITGYLIELLVLPVEPLNWVDRISPRPFLMINGYEDERVARESIDLLFNKALEPKEIIWHKSKHIEPIPGELTQELTEILGNWLQESGLLGR